MNGGGTSGKITVLLVDDSPLALTMLKRILAPCADIEVVGTANNGREALELVPKLSPRVICTDLHMPVMDGFELTREVMDMYPTPILVVSASVNEGSRNVFQVIEAGAVDVFPKPQGILEGGYCDQRNELAQKIRILAGVSVVRRRQRTETLPPPPSNGELAAFPKIVTIGASTGGPVALQRILSALPSSFPLPIVCVQHISDGFLQGLVEWLGSVCDLKVEIAQEGWLPSRGTVYFPPEGKHLVFDAGGRFRYSLEEQAVNGHRPSVSVTFESAAVVFGGAVIGVLLTGMGNDGAAGMKAIHDAGGTTIAQDEKTSVVFGMPKCAIELGAAREIVPLQDIASSIISYADINRGIIQR